MEAMSALPIPLSPVPLSGELAFAAAMARPEPREPWGSARARSALVEQLSQRHARLRIHRPAAPQPEVAPETRFSFAALTGRLVEISSDAQPAGLTLAVRLIRQAQEVEDIAAWVGGAESGFYPPDVAAHGVDLAQLAVVRVGTPEAIAKAGARLAQSGGFGLIVLDLTSVQRLSDAHLGRLAQQALHHEAAVVCLTRKPAGRESLGSLISLRAEAQARRVGPDRFVCDVRVLKDKRNGAGWHHEEVCGGPPGLH